MFEVIYFISLGNNNVNQGVVCFWVSLISCYYFAL